MIDQGLPESTGTVIQPVGMQTRRINQLTCLAQQGHDRGLSVDAKGIEHGSLSALITQRFQHRHRNEDGNTAGVG